MVISPRRPSASRRTFWASRPSSQNPGSWVSASISATRASFASRSKVPRGRLDPLGQVSDGGCFHLVPGLQILEQDRAQLDETQRGLAPGDYGVHAGTIAVVRADPAVAVTVKCRCITARPAVTLTGDQIDERCFLGLLHGLPLYVLGKGGWGPVRGRALGPGGPEFGRVLAQYTGPNPYRQGGKSFLVRVGHRLRPPPGSAPGRHPWPRSRGDASVRCRRRPRSSAPALRVRARWHRPGGVGHSRSGWSGSANPSR